MSAIQPMDTTITDTTTNQNIQITDSMELDKLLKHIAKKLKAATYARIPMILPTELLHTCKTLTQNDETPELPKISKIMLSCKKASILRTVSHDTVLLDIKFLHNNPYIVIMTMRDFLKDYCITIQQSNLMHNLQKVNEPVQDKTDGRLSTITDANQVLLEDESIYFNFVTTGSGPQKMEDDMDATSNNTYQDMKDTNTISNTIVEDQILKDMWSVDSTEWPDIVKAWIIE
ncbi:33415_t:CDS:2 [Gigaspora margarita]|uniref:33415_t:CDS:1 n=1 Tax=Gigaspora margarita TaxID=4874 RepID=A0ABN7U8C5_GIGMA|nr:33415_t:CDS:2 [Gigaspora margarita]